MKESVILPSDWEYQLDRVATHLTNAIKEINNFENGTGKYAAKKKKLYKEIKDELEYIGQSSVDKYYESYEPKVYNDIGFDRYYRRYRLYGAYKVTVDDNTWGITYNHDDLGYDDLDEYIFNTMFKGGWHGGADKGNGHPEPGTPWWRVPVVGKGTYYFTKQSGWLSSAVRSKESPYEMIEEKSKKYLKKADEKYNKLIDEPLDKLVDDAIEDIYRFVDYLGL